MTAEQRVQSFDEGKPAGVWSEFFEAVKPLVSAATKIVHEERLGTKTTMRVGGAARIYAEPASVADLQVLLREARAGGGEERLALDGGLRRGRSTRRLGRPFARRTIPTGDDNFFSRREFERIGNVIRDGDIALPNTIFLGNHAERLTRLYRMLHATT